MRFAGEDPDAPENFPRVLNVWRANLLGSSAKGNEYFLKHLLGTDHAVRGDPGPVRHHQRPPGHPGFPCPGGPHGHTARGPGRGARGQADHLRRHPGRPGAGHHLP
nr:molybdopterin-dependent oxidoreductase [Wenjunlia tyrosinilytica]